MAGRGLRTVRAGFTLDDLLNHPGVVMHELDRSSTAPMTSTGCAGGGRLVAESLYDPVGGVGS